MKVRLTESQIKKVKLITEGREILNKFLEKVDTIRDKVNRLYTKITYTTLAELLEGESDLEVYLGDLEIWRTVLHTHYNRSKDFFNKVTSDEYNKWEDLDTKVKETYEEIQTQKIDALEDLISKMKDFAEEDIESYFKDVKKLDI